MTVWLTGMLAIASLIMCVGLWQIVRQELADGSQHWWLNKALRLSGAFYLHGVGAIILFASSLLAGINTPTGIVIYSVWAGLGLWLLAKTMIISVSGGFRLCLMSYMAWTTGCAAWGMWG